MIQMMSRETRIFILLSRILLEANYIPAFRSMASGFDQEWAQKSVKTSLLSETKGVSTETIFLPGEPVRPVQNALFTHKLKDYRYLGSSLVTDRCRNGYACHGSAGLAIR